MLCNCYGDRGISFLQICCSLDRLRARRLRYNMIRIEGEPRESANGVCSTGDCFEESCQVCATLLNLALSVGADGRDIARVALRDTLRSLIASNETIN